MTRENALRYTLLPAALMVLGLMPATSQAKIEFQLTSPGSVNTDVNLGAFQQTGDINTITLLNLNANKPLGQDTPILRVDAFTDLTMTTEAGIVSQGGGQAKIEITNTSTPANYTILTPIAPFQGFSILEFNPHTVKGGITGSFYLIGTDQFGTAFTSANFEFDDSGQNRVAAIGLEGQVITKLEFVATSGKAGDFRQFRIVTGVVAVPETSTVTMAAIVGSIPLGLAGLRRLRRRAVSTSA